MIHFLFSTRKKRVDLYLFVLMAVAIVAVRTYVSLWIVESYGAKISDWYTLLEQIPSLTYCLCFLIVLLTALYVLRHLKDYYRSKQSLFALLFAAIVLLAYAEYWKYIPILGKFSFLHLLLFCILIAFLSICVFGGNKSGQGGPELSGRAFTTDTVETEDRNIVDKNRLAYADYLVDRILGTQMRKGSFSLGVSGEWGTGKTSFLYAVAHSLKKHFPGRVASLVWFKPWNSSSPQQIIIDFFNVLIDQIGPQYSVIRKPMLKYAELLKAMDVRKPIIYLADIYDRYRDRSLESVKKIISDYLLTYNKIIPVLIDDMDRLSGDEIVQVLRLIRNTADFPNVVYVTAYDKGYLVSQLQKKGILNPETYIEKFFSVEFALPKLEDNYQYDVFAHEIYEMSSEPAIIRYVNRMPETTQQLLCSAFHNFRQVKRFARIFVNDAEFFNTKYGLVQHLSIDDLLLLKLLYYTDSDLYRKLELEQDKLMVRGKDIWKGFYPLKLRPRVFDSNDKENPMISSYSGNPISGLSKEILEVLFALNDSKNAQNFVNHESYPLYFSLDINGHHISVLEVRKTIAGESDLDEAFSRWNQECKLVSVYYHLLSFNPGTMDEYQAKRFLKLAVNVIPYLSITRTIIDKCFISGKYQGFLRDNLKDYVRKEFSTLISGVTLEEMLQSAHKSIAQALMYVYELEMTEERENGNTGKTLIGDTGYAIRILEENFNKFVSSTYPDTDELFRDNSMLQDIVRANVLIVDIDDGTMTGPNLIAETIISYFKSHKGKDKKTAAEKYLLPQNCPIPFEEDVMAGLIEKKESVFGSGDLYNRLLSECFE